MESNLTPQEEEFIKRMNKEFEDLTDYYYDNYTFQFVHDF